MNQQGKRRARFRKGFEPPPLSESATHAPASKGKSLESAVVKGPKPLPSPEAIREKFIDSTLIYLAQQSPDFWDTSIGRRFYYRSDFLGKLRLGKHLEEYNLILDACRTAQFPSLQHGRLSVTFPKPPAEAGDTPAISFELAPDSEWNEALAELRVAAGIVTEPIPSPEARQLIEFAAKVPAGERRIVPKEITDSWNNYHFGDVVLEAQINEPRLFKEQESEYRYRVVVGPNPHPWLLLPPLQTPLSMPKEAIKASFEDVANQIEKIVLAENGAGRLGTDWLVLIRTSSRLEAAALFGGPIAGGFGSIFAKVRPTGMYTHWQFGGRNSPWVVAVRPDKGLTWPLVIEAIRARANEVPSATLYGLSSAAAGLFDWLRKLPSSEFELALSPVISEKILVTEIGFKNPWSDENGILYFRLLAEEISRKTPFVAVAHPWKQYARFEVRIEFRASDLTLPP